MIKKFLLFAFSCSFYGFSNPAIELCQEAQEFFCSGHDWQPTLDESVAYILNLRLQIEELGYEVPTIQEIISQLDDQFQVNGLSSQMQIAFSAEESLGDLSGHFYCCSQNRNDTDWGKLAVGGCIILAGGLLSIIPFGYTRGLATGMILLGLDKVLDATLDAGEANERRAAHNMDGTTQYEKGLYD